jgi:hypothetical protein
MQLRAKASRDATSQKKRDQGDNSTYAARTTIKAIATITLILRWLAWVSRKTNDEHLA